MVVSLLAEIVATSFNLPLVTLRAFFLRLSHIFVVFATNSRRTSVLFTSGVMCSIPALTKASVRTMAVVVPSPAEVAVLSAASFIIRTARFSVGSNRSTAFATVTPSLVTVIPWVWFGDSISTVCPEGPSVDFTAADIVLIPLINLSRPSWSNFKFFGLYPISFIIFDFLQR